MGRDDTSQQIAALTAAIHRLAEGDFAVRSRISYQQGEIGQLAAAFDALAEVMAQRASECRQAEAVLQHSGEQYRLLFETNPNPMWIIDHETLTFLAVNEAMIHQYGYAREELLRMTALDIRPPADVPRLVHHISTRNDVFRHSGIWQHQKKDGSIIDVEVFSHSIIFDHRPALFVLAHDVTKQKRTAEALRQSEARYQAVVEAQSDLVCRYLPDATLTFVNEAYCRYFGKTREELLGRSFVSLLPDEIGASTLENVRFLCEHPQVVSHEYPIVALNGEQQWQQWICYPIFNDNGQLIEFQAVGRDITERRRSEQEREQYSLRLQVLNDMSRALLESSSASAIAQVALEHLRQLIPCQQTSVSLFDFIAQQGTVLAVSTSLASRIGKNYQFRLTDAGNIDERTQGQIVVNNSLTEAPLSSIFRQLYNEGVRAILTIPLLTPHTLVGSLTLGAITEGFFTVEHIKSAREVADFLAIAITQHQLREEVQQRAQELTTTNARLRAEEEQLAHTLQQLRALTARQQSVREEEQTRIAREVHDELGQALSGLKMDCAWLAKQLRTFSDTTLGFSLFTKTQEMIKMINETINAVRRISTELRPALLDTLGLVAALEWQAQDFHKRTGIRCSFTTDADELTVEPQVATAIFRICQEALTNVARHANAQLVQIILRKNEKSLTLEVQDDGKGLPETDIMAPTSLGLLGIRERARLLGGECLIQGKPGVGTTVIVQLPEARTS